MIRRKKWIADHFDFEIGEKHRRATDKTIEDLRNGNELYDEVLRAASISSFFGAIGAVEKFRKMLK
jgi:hypothetical protein